MLSINIRIILITVCYKDIDLFFVLDSSGSIGIKSYTTAKEFIANLVSGFTIGRNNVRVGLVVFGDITV